MSIKLSVLRTGENIISDVKEIMSEDNVVGYLMGKPHLVECERNPILIEENEDLSNVSSEFQIILSPWIVLSKDEQIPIRPDWIVTVVEPVSILKQMYEEKVNEKNDQVDFTDEQ